MKVVIRIIEYDIWYLTLKNLDYIEYSLCTFEFALLILPQKIQTESSLRIVVWQKSSRFIRTGLVGIVFVCEAIPTDNNNI